MSRFHRWAGAIAALVLSCAGAKAQVGPTESPCDLGEAALAARLAELRPVIEQVLGAAIPGTLTVRVTAARELAELFYESGVVRRCGLRQGADAERLRKAVRAESVASCTECLGFVDSVDATIHVVPDAIRATAAARSDGLSVAAVRDLVLVHEAVHVYQQRVLGAQAFLQWPRTLEDGAGIAAVVEGHAHMVTAEVAAKLGLERALAAFADVLWHDHAPMEALAGLEDVNAYELGARFLRAVSARLGRKDAVAKAFRDPPARLRHLVDPAEYLAPGEAGVDLAAIGEAVTEVLVEKDALASSVVFPGPLLRLDAFGLKGAVALDPQSLETCVEAVVIRSFRMGEGGRPRHTNALLALSSTPEGARGLIDALDWAKKLPEPPPSRDDLLKAASVNLDRTVASLVEMGFSPRTLRLLPPGLPPPSVASISFTMDRLAVHVLVVGPICV